MRILVVDDDEITQEMLHKTLTQAGYEVRIARDGGEAYEILRNDPYRLVICDWVMPVMDGIELCRRIRSGDFSSYIYIILLTARGQTKDVVEGLSTGADDFIGKPFSPAELCVRVRAGERILSLETRDLAIFALAKLAESRDNETGAHLERMRNYSRILAQQLAKTEKYRDTINSEYVHMIYLTSLLHDIGKVGIPDRVLLKPGRLNHEEFEIMKRHTIIGAETLDAMVREHPGVQFLRMARDIAQTHHERYDGSGYPQGLVGTAIPLCGRIVALADVYDALTTKRVYKEAFVHESAKAIIVQQSGTHFDPDVVNAFIESESQFVAIRNRYAESERPLKPSATDPAAAYPRTPSAGETNERTANPLTDTVTAPPVMEPVLGLPH